MSTAPVPASAQQPAEYRFTVLGKPFPQPRPRAASRGGLTQIYTPDPQGQLSAWKRAVAYQVKAERPEKFPKGTALAIFIKFFLPRPKTHFREGMNAGKLRAGAPPFPVAMSRDDWDNLAKSTTDAMTGICWEDDSQIVDARILKVYSDTPRQSGAVIIIREKTED